MSQIVKELYEALVSVGAEREAAGAAAVSVAPGRDVAEMKETLAAIQTELPAMEGRLRRQIGETTVEAADIETRRTGRIAEVETNLTGQIAEVEIKLTDRITDVETKLTNRIADVEIRLTDRIADVETKLTGRIAAVETKLTRQIAELTDRIADVEARLTRRIADLETKLASLATQMAGMERRMYLMWTGLVALLIALKYLP